MPEHIYLGGYQGYPWSLAFSTAEKARTWLLNGPAGDRQTTWLAVDDPDAFPRDLAKEDSDG